MMSCSHCGKQSTGSNAKRNVALRFTILESAVFYVIPFCNSWCEQIKQLLLTSGADMLAAVEILEPEQAFVSQIA